MTIKLLELTEELPREKQTELLGYIGALETKIQNTIKCLRALMTVHNLQEIDHDNDRTQSD